MNALNLTLYGFSLLLDFLPLQENFIELASQFLILCLDMKIGIFHIFWSCIYPQFVKSKIVVCQLTLQIPYFSGKILDSCFEFII